MRSGSSHIAYNPMTGVKTDFSTLLKKFVDSGSVRYEQFVEIWREMKMSLIFAGRQNDAEVRQFTENCIDLAKSHVLPPNEFQIQIGGLYLMYALFFKQLFEPKVRIRVTMEEWSHIQNLLTEVRSQQHYDIECIFWTLRHSNAFYYVAHLTPQSGLLHYVAENSGQGAAQNQEATTELENLQQDRSMVTDLMEGDAIDQLSAIHDQYHRVKCAMLAPDAKTPQASLNMIDYGVVQYITKKITTFEFWKKTRAGKRPGRRRHDSGPTTSESEAESESEKSPSSPKRSKTSNMGSRRAEIKARAMAVSGEQSRSRRHRQVRSQGDVEASPRTPTRAKEDLETSDDEANISKTDSQELDSTFSPGSGELLSMPAFRHLEEKQKGKGKSARKQRLSSAKKSTKAKLQVHVDGKKKKSQKKRISVADVSASDELTTSIVVVSESNFPLGKKNKRKTKKGRDGNKSTNADFDKTGMDETFEHEDSSMNKSDMLDSSTLSIGSEKPVLKPESSPGQRNRRGIGKGKGKGARGRQPKNKNNL